MTPSIWPSTILLIFWSIVAGLVLSQWLPMPARSGGLLLWAIAGLVALGLARAIVALRRSVHALVTAADQARGDDRRTGAP